MPYAIRFRMVCDKRDNYGTRSLRVRNRYEHSILVTGWYVYEKPPETWPVPLLADSFLFSAGRSLWKVLPFLSDLHVWHMVNAFLVLSANSGEIDKVHTGFSM